MSEEAEIIKTIIEVKQEGNPLKDYFYPLVVTFFGAFFAHYAVKYQKYIDAQRQKLETANNWVVTFQGVYEGLISVKRTYAGRINENPLTRTSAIQEQIHLPSKVELDMGGLSFLVPDKDDESALNDKWRSLPRINSMQSNYNFLVGTWHRRNALAAEIIPKIVSEYGEQGAANISLDQAIECVGQEVFLPYMDLTEYIIKITDELLLETYDFVSKFEKSSRQCIDTFRVKNYGKLLSYKNETDGAKEMMKKCPEVNYQLLAAMFKTPVDRIKERYVTGYEDESIYDVEELGEIASNIKKYEEEQLLRRKFRWWW